jgi:hypothetical protein
MILIKNEEIKKKINPILVLNAAPQSRDVHGVSIIVTLWVQLIKI